MPPTVRARAGRAWRTRMKRWAEWNAWNGIRDGVGHNPVFCKAITSTKQVHIIMPPHPEQEGVNPALNVACVVAVLTVVGYCPDSQTRLLLRTYPVAVE